MESLLKPKDSTTAEAVGFHNAILAYWEDFNYPATIAEAVKKLTKAEFAARLADAVDAQKLRRLTVYLNARGTAPSVMKDELQIGNVTEFHKAVKKYVKAPAQ